MSWSEHDALTIDLYEMTMAHAYRRAGMNGEAVFDAFVRRLPATRNVLLACGVEEAIDRVLGLRFSKEDVEAIAGIGGFSDEFLDWLAAYRFHGSIRAIPEGTPVFPNEPVLDVRAPLAESQIVETLVLSCLHLPMLSAAKAFRVVEAARGAAVVDFGLRRSHGGEPAYRSARAFWIAGVAGTSNVAAGVGWGMPIRGTMAHSYVEAHADEKAAFRSFLEAYPGGTLLVDTYDTLTGVDRVVELAREKGPDFHARAIRIDSGDLDALSREARRRLDGAGLDGVRIVVSGDLDEDRIAALTEAGAPIDGYGVGTSLVVSTDAPSVDLVYKLVEYGGSGRVKDSPGKATWPGRKQVYRRFTDGIAAGDVVTTIDEKFDGEPLLVPFVENGERVRPADGLDAIRERTRREIARLPRGLRALAPADPPYPVERSERLEAARREAVAALTEAQPRKAG